MFERAGIGIKPTATYLHGIAQQQMNGGSIREKNTHPE
jgi:hypothetical protein